ncbi:type 1 periplasmic binding fold superfamily protein [Maribacter sp. 2307ULW6-5]|uniref:type 1 periplasmic binding fold superfamily protein n=1 Tax=Maribacter sp. 2307ULW6-5 TaxID=3386275 RepID=UPI0039BC998D
MKKVSLDFRTGRATMASMALLAGVFFVSCDNDDDNPEAVDEEEVITTMNVSLTATGSTVNLQVRDLDGDGPDEPEITVSGNLASNTTYVGSIELLNETETPTEDITLEIREEDDEHQFFFAATGSIANVTATDTDGDGNPLGLTFSLETGDAGAASLSITLRHEPKKPNDGTLADARGETDIAQTFNLVVE